MSTSNQWEEQFDAEFLYPRFFKRKAIKAFISQQLDKQRAEIIAMVEGIKLDDWFIESSAAGKRGHKLALDQVIAKLTK